MKTKHTPGPWIVKVHDKGTYFTEVEVWHENYGRLAIMPDNTSIWNSDKNEEAAKDALEQTIYNAHLMAAAPELLDALEYAHTILKGLADGGWYPTKMLVENGGQGFEPIVNAIKKATE